MFLLYFTIYILLGAVAGYCFLRVFSYPILKTLVDESEFFSNPKYKESMNIFCHARLYPWPIWDDVKRQRWIKAWWQFAVIGLVSFCLSIFSLYMLEIMKTKGLG